MSKVTDKIREELAELLPPTVFFFVSLHVVVLVRTLMLKGTGISLGTTASVGVAALVLGKAVLLADLLPFINRFPAKPLAYNVAWKTLVYFLVALALHYLEHLYDFWRETGSFIAGNEKLLAQIVWAHFWAIQILLLALILIYCAAREVCRVIGGDAVRRMFFGPLAVAPARP